MCVKTFRGFAMRDDLREIGCCRRPNKSVRTNRNREGACAAALEEVAHKQSLLLTCVAYCRRHYKRF